jgi:ATP-binding protein involved in chromosome partitioning
MADPQTTEADVQAAVADFRDPETGRPALQLEQIRNIKIEDNQLTLELALTTHSAPIWEETRESLVQILQERLPQLNKVQVDLAKHQRAPQKLGEVGLTAKSVIAVGSGKGGVGKSTIAASLALGLKRAGASVGLLDADVYGPSIPQLLGVDGRPEVVNERIQPIWLTGMPVMSMGFLVPKEEAVIWRGPMLHGAITQFLRDTEWGDLDYLIIDMPPGTGDVALTLSQLLPLTGAVVVCTPQDVALLDAVKAISMFRKVNIPVLGMVENMSGFVCPGCQKRYDIFGHGGALKRAEELGVPVLGEVPINLQIREHGDAGTTSALADDPQNAPWMEGISQRLVTNLAAQAVAKPKMPELPVL